MNNEELIRRIQALEAQLREIQDYISDRKVQQITFPIDDASRQIFGMGVVGEDTGATTPARSVIVETNVGQLKVLVAN